MRGPLGEGADFTQTHGGVQLPLIHARAVVEHGDGAGGAAPRQCHIDLVRMGGNAVIDDVRQRRCSRITETTQGLDHRRWPLGVRGANYRRSSPYSFGGCSTGQSISPASVQAREGCRSFRSALPSICRTLSRVTPKTTPTCSRVRSLSSSRPNRSRRIPASLGSREAEQAAHHFAKGCLHRQRFGTRRGVGDRFRDCIGLIMFVVWPVHGDDLRSGSKCLQDPVDRQVQAVRDGLRTAGVAGRFEFSPASRDPVDGVHHMDRHPDEPRLISNRAGDRLANPPGRIGRELEAAAILEFFYGAHQPEVSLLNQVSNGQSADGRIFSRLRQRAGGWPWSSGIWPVQPGQARPIGRRGLPGLGRCVRGYHRAAGAGRSESPSSRRASNIA